PQGYPLPLHDALPLWFAVGDGADALGALLRVEGDAVPHPELVAVGVGEPPHPFAGRVDGADPGAVRPVGHLALRPGVTVPRVDLDRKSRRLHSSHVKI